MVDGRWLAGENSERKAELLLTMGDGFIEDDAWGRGCMLLLVHWSCGRLRWMTGEGCGRPTIDEMMLPLQSSISFTILPQSSTSNNPFNPSSTSSSDFPVDSTTTEDEDTANCLILLSKGHNIINNGQFSTDKFNNKRYIQTTTDTVDELTGIYVYECKTYSRTCPSFLSKIQTLTVGDSPVWCRGFFSVRLRSPIR
ncbi:hypothetical protein L6452_05646 [Arctium lappa]|uniref:Uncharacterized protein n=1 Tax=Arctium lappa TaxID=4217 RepID=A0ACB9EHQ0_ARCLA|nr:hypothetical protein L6452_05646 [Arctium lappa]